MTPQERFRRRAAAERVIEDILVRCGAKLEPVGNLWREVRVSNITERVLSAIDDGKLK